MSLLQSPLSCHDLYCSTSPFCRDHSLLSIHYSTGFSWCHFQLLFLCALFPMGHLLSYCKKYYPTQLWLLEIMHLFLISTSPRNICKLYFLEIFSEYFMKVEDLNMPPLIIILMPYHWPSFKIKCFFYLFEKAMECFHLNLITGIVLYDVANYDVVLLFIYNLAGHTCLLYNQTLVYLVFLILLFYLFRWKIFRNCGKPLLHVSRSIEEKLWARNRHMECGSYIVYFIMWSSSILGW